MSPYRTVPFDAAPAALGPALGMIGLGATVCAVMLFAEPASSTSNASNASPKITVGHHVGRRTPSGDPAPTEQDARLLASSSAHAVTCAPMELTFGPASTVPDEETRAAVDALAVWLVGHPGVDVIVDGHADTRGRQEVNMWVSHERAASVGTALVKAGVAKARITVRGFGSYQPVIGADATAPRQRRVVVTMTSTDGCPGELPGAERTRP
jgi:outer membrane protein OmpA-like peptidoglycan-associated protein